MLNGSIPRFIKFSVSPITLLLSFLFSFAFIPTIYDQEYLCVVKLGWDSSFEKMLSAVKVVLTIPFLWKHGCRPPSTLKPMRWLRGYELPPRGWMGLWGVHIFHIPVSDIVCGKMGNSGDEGVKEMNKQTSIIESVTLTFYPWYLDMYMMTITH